MSATARLAAPKTVYAFPGQGIQHKGMGMEVRARSKAARQVWDKADKFTRDTLGFWCCTWSGTTRPAWSPRVCTTSTPKGCCT